MKGNTKRYRWNPPNQNSGLAQKRFFLVFAIPFPLNNFWKKVMAADVVSAWRWLLHIYLYCSSNSDIKIFVSATFFTPCQLFGQNFCHHRFLFFREPSQNTMMNFDTNLILKWFPFQNSWIHRSSTCCLTCFFWLLNCVIYLKLTRVL